GLAGTIVGGTVVVTAPARFAVEDGETGQLNGVRVSGTLTVRAAPLAVTNGLTLNGTLDVGGQSSRPSTVRLAGAQTLGGTAAVVFDSFPNRLEAAGGVVTFGPAVTVSGGRAVLANVRNQGLIPLNAGSAFLTLARTWQNAGAGELGGGTPGRG